MTEHEIIAHILGGGLYGFGGRVSVSARLKIAEGIVRALSAGGYKIIKVTHTTRKPFEFEETSDDRR